MQRLLSSRVLPVATALLVAGCAAGEALDVNLSVDPAISTEADLAASLSELTFILDSDEGLYPPGAERSSGAVRVENADADPELEVVTVVPVTDSHLPVVRIERGGLSVPSVDLRVFGRSKESGAPVADGQARGLAFGGDDPTENVPFNFRDSLRPPRVRSVFPEDGSSIVGCDVPTVTLVFSRPMDPATLTPDSVRVEPPGTAAVTIAVATSGLVADVQLTPVLSGDGSHVQVHLVVTDGARAADGKPLDQAGSEEGSQPFDAVIRLDCGPPPSFPCELDKCQWACGGAKECLNLPQIACASGVCVPTKCSVECASPDVCDPLGDRCVPDCRSGSSSSACASGACDPSTGLCVDGS